MRSSGGLLGAENVIIELAKFSSENGFESIVGAINNLNDPYPEFLKLASEYGIKNILFQCRGHIDFKCIQAIKSYIVENNINLLHTHGYKENIFALLTSNSIPRIATNHLWKGNSVKAKLYCLIDKLCIRYFDSIVGVSDEIVQQMKSLKIKNLHKIANGVDIQKFVPLGKNKALMSKYGLRQNDLIYGIVSSLSPEKNHKIVINALKIIDNPYIKLLIVGDGSLREVLMNQVQEAGFNNNVIFTGSQQNIVDYLSVIDVFLLPSLTEGLPMALLEAMACGKAVIASRVGEIPKVVQHENDGLLVRPDNLEEIARAIQLLSRERELIEQYGNAARTTVEKNFSSKKMAQQYCAVYDSFF